MTIHGRSLLDLYANFDKAPVRNNEQNGARYAPTSQVHASWLTLLLAWN